MSVTSMIIHKNYKWGTWQRLRTPLRLILILLGTCITVISPGFAQEERYGVYINSDSVFLLEVVQQVQPGAVIRRYRNRRIIDAGIYFRESEAERVVEDLQAVGVDSQITDFEDEKEFTGAITAFPPVVPLPTEEDKPIETNFPPIYVFPEGSLGLYQVFVSVNDAALFEVLQVAPYAEIKEYQGKLIIQAGSFLNLGNAQQLMDELNWRGIPSEVIQSLRELQLWVAIQPEIPATRVTATPANPGGGYGLSETNRYFVLIPTQPADLNIVANDVVALGAPEQSVIVQDLEVDPFVAVGPFSSETLAEEWENYFIDAGIPGAQVYFGK
ncbi:hypothetical protein [Lyngbya sp. PCC 8106]|uniref:hypothetical protein n=1 Tax=Lyngbya sp. (strain PCC 8106) TaxID=313612 RepID=UPI0000EAD5AA|nr:hypothetical protein [Lyngbya sp. PCC 8106]EAW37629.1 hypothetical protein L8106_16569 [Lyngbya sp. PCC 8106]